MADVTWEVSSESVQSGQVWIVREEEESEDEDEMCANSFGLWKVDCR